MRCLSDHQVRSPTGTTASTCIPRQRSLQIVVVTITTLIMRCRGGVPADREIDHMVGQHIHSAAVAAVPAVSGLHKDVEVRADLRGDLIRFICRFQDKTDNETAWT